MTLWDDLEETPLDEGPRAGLLATLHASIDARRVCAEWPRSAAKRSKAFRASPRKNWRGVPLVYRLLASIRLIGPDECWLWEKTVDGCGYGIIYKGTRILKVTHLVLEIEGRPRPQGLCALHSCDTPACCNPRHLRWGTHRENMADMVSRGRQNPIGLEVSHRRQRESPYCRSGRHLLSETGRSRRDGKRFCVTCSRERENVR